MKKAYAILIYIAKHASDTINNLTENVRDGFENGFRIEIGRPSTSANLKDDAIEQALERVEASPNKNSKKKK
jgi:hypothetical protein